MTMSMNRMLGRVDFTGAIVVVALLTMAATSVLTAQTSQNAGGEQAASQSGPERLLQSARNKEVVEGRIEEAITIYQRVIAQYRNNRSVAAQALVHVAACYEKLGASQATEARKAYEQLVRDYGDQTQLVAQARTRLAALGGGSTARATPRLVSRDNANVFRRLSPDGRVTLRFDNGAIAVRDEQTGATHTLGTSKCYGGVISEDSRQVAYTCRTKEGSDLRVARVDGSGDRVVSHNRWPQRWFPDGKRLLTVTWQEKTTELSVDVVSTTDGTSKTLLSSNFEFDIDLSPDGHTIIYSKPTAEGASVTQLWSMNVEDGHETQFFEWSSAIYTPLFTPDGSGVVFLSDRRQPGKSADLWLTKSVAGKASGIPEMLFAGLSGFADGQPAVSPFAITRDGAYHYRPFAGSPLIQVLAAPFDQQTGSVTGPPSFASKRGGISRSPSFSPDGRWLSFVADGKDIVVKSMDSGEEKVIATSQPFQDMWAIWFPDSRSFLVSASRDNNINGLYRVDAATGAFTPVSKAGEPFVVGWPDAISPDGRTIYFNRWADPGSALIERDLESGRERELTRGIGELFALSPDGKVMAISHPEGKDFVIDLVPLAGGQKRQIYRAAGVAQVSLCWTPDGRFLIIAPSETTVRNEKALYRLSIADGSVQPIGVSIGQDPRVDFPRSLGGPRVSPDGRFVAYAARGRTSINEEWVLENFLPKTGVGKR